MTNKLYVDMNITFESIIGKHILVGITFLDKKGKIIKIIQFGGKIVKADKNKGITIEKTNSKETFELPPDLSSIKIAEPGEYKLKSTGEIVKNPDLITTWIIEKRRYNR